MNELENGMVLTDYTPMMDSDKPVLVCSWCGERGHFKTKKDDEQVNAS